MRKIVVVESLTLDGVMQAPGGADEDVRAGFVHGGWASPYNDEVMAREMGKGMGRTELLFGRRTNVGPTRTSIPSGPTSRNQIPSPRCSTIRRSTWRRRRSTSRFRGSTRRF